jgi:hypothetical protein
MEDNQNAPEEKSVQTKKVRRSNRKRKSQYEADLERRKRAALESWKKGVPVSKLVKNFDIPKTTLYE